MTTSLADDKFLPSGTYAIMNVASNRYIALSEEDESLSTSDEEYGWSVSFLGNQKWTIQGACDIFIGLSPYSEEGDNVLAVKNPPKPHRWLIKRRTAQNYIIYSPSQPHLLWSLPNDDEGTTPQLSADHANSSLWRFKKIQAHEANLVLDRPSSYLYYRVYYKEDAVPTKRPAYVNDAFVGRTSSEWIPPPRSVYTLRVFLSTLENIDPSATRLFATSFSNVPLEDNRPFSTLGSNAITPLILVSDVFPEDGMEPGTEHFLVPPELHLTPRLLYYAIFTINGPLPSKSPVNADEPWVSSINLDTIPPLFSVASLKQRICAKEENNGLPELFIDKDAMYPFNRDYFPANDGYWPGSTVLNPIMLEFPVRRPLKIAESAVYFIHNCSTNKPLTVGNNHIYLGSLFCSGFYSQNMHAAFKLQDDSGFSIGSKYHKGWLGPDLTFQDAEHSFHFIRSKENKNWFSIRRDSTFCQALYDHGYDYAVSWKDFQASDRNCLWRLEAAE